MTELSIWKKEELDKLRKDLDSRFSRFRRGFGVPRAFMERAEMFSDIPIGNRRSPCFEDRTSGGPGREYSAIRHR